jgi:hypothetical protein
MHLIAALDRFLQLRQARACPSGALAFSGTSDRPGEERVPSRWIGIEVAPHGPVLAVRELSLFPRPDQTLEKVWRLVFAGNGDADSTLPK